MRRAEGINHVFVDRIPVQLEDGLLYVCIEFATAVHLCACRCGNEVVTPLSPTDWRLVFDGETVSLHPSIGNWSFACQSHYWIVRNRIRWSRRWSPGEIARVRDLDIRAKERQFGSQALDVSRAAKPAPNKPLGRIGRFMISLRRRLKGH